VASEKPLRRFSDARRPKESLLASSFVRIRGALNPSHSGDGISLASGREPQKLDYVYSPLAALNLGHPTVGDSKFGR
jgi:hypothetical protein